MKSIRIGLVRSLTRLRVLSKLTCLLADIRKCPDVPPLPTNEYSFEPGDLLPPVGSTYLLHLFKHPEDYDGEMITYLRSPKKHNGQLKYGVGWGINLVEGFLADRVWMVVRYVPAAYHTTNDMLTLCGLVPSLQ